MAGCLAEYAEMDGMDVSVDLVGYIFIEFFN